MKNTLLAIGEALIDMIPQQTGCEFNEVKEFAPMCGGAPANVCGAYTALGGQARMITQLGQDPFGQKIIEELKQYHIDTSCISFSPSANTALAFVSLSQDGNRTFSFYRKPSADMLLDKRQVIPEWFTDAYALHFCSVSLGDFPMRKAHEKAIRLSRKQGAIISFDPNLRFQLWEDKAYLYQTIWKFIPQADILKISDEELEFIAEKRDIDSALDRLFCGHVKLIIYTCGSGGAYAFTRKNKAYVEGVKVSAVDTTGAGDGFIGSFLYKLNQKGIQLQDLQQLNNDVLTECLDFSNRFCVESIQKQGAIASYPTKFA